ncbi:C40 family peptidase [Pseudomonadota bacterium]
MLEEFLYAGVFKTAETRKYPCTLSTHAKASAASHVGIYVDGKRFIHAPSGGKHVAYASLDNPYWETRVIGAGRFH